MVQIYYTGVELATSTLTSADSFEELTTVTSGLTKQLPAEATHLLGIYLAVSQEVRTTIEGTGYQWRLNIPSCGINDAVYDQNVVHFAEGANGGGGQGAFSYIPLRQKRGSPKSANFKVELAVSNAMSAGTPAAAAVIVTSNGGVPADYYIQAALGMIGATAIPTDNGDVEYNNAAKTTGEETGTALEIDSDARRLEWLSISCGPDGGLTAGETSLFMVTLRSSIPGFEAGKADFIAMPWNPELGTPATDQVMTVRGIYYPLMRDVNIQADANVSWVTSALETTTTGFNIGVGLGVVSR